MTILSHFTLPESCWLMNYYNPMEQALEEIRQKYNENEEALSVFQGSADEIEFYKRNSKDYGYEFFVMQKDD